MKTRNDKILEQHDLVDNLCHKLAQDILNISVSPEANFELEWDMEFIGAIRDEVVKYLEVKLSLSEEDIYPPLEKWQFDHRGFLYWGDYESREAAEHAMKVVIAKYGYRLQDMVGPYLVRD